MQVASLGSGSKGNGTLVRSGDLLCLVDCGFTLKETCLRLARLGVQPEQLDAVLVTHEHGDHSRGVAALAARYDLTVYASFGTCQAGPERLGLSRCRIHEVRPGRPFTVGNLRVEPVPVPHDAREPCQYVFDSGQRRLGVLTDLGSVTGQVLESYHDCDALVLEANHDTGMLAGGPYPPSLKRRVGGRLGHLSNDQSANLLGSINHERLQHLVMSHLSEQNNTPQRVWQAVTAAIPVGHERITVASQNRGFDWLTIN